MARAEATVNLEVKGAVQGAAEVRLLSKELDRLNRKSTSLKGGAKSIQSVGASLQTLTITGRGTRKVFDSLDKGIKGFGTAMTKFLSVALKATILQFGLLSIALVGVHALFIAGRWLQKAYAWGMTALAGAAASAAVGLGTMAAAIREQQAAMYAYTKGGAGEFISGTNQVRVAMRTLQADSQLAGLGVESLNKAYAAMAKSMKSSQIAQSGGMMKKLMDFGAAGQDPAAAAEKVGALIEALENSKTSMSAVKEAAKGLGPQMEEALKKAKVTSKKQLKELIMSGELAKMGGVAGQFEAVNVTLIGKLKSYFTQLRTEFADFGQVFLGPAKVALEKIFRIIRKDLVRTGTALGDFGSGSMMDGLVTAVEKTSNFFVKLVRDWLPKTDGFFTNMADWWGKVVRWFRVIRENLRPFLEGAEAIEAMFSPIWEALKGGFTTSINNFNKRAIDSKEEFKEIGESLGKLITELFKLQEVFSQTFSDALPFLSDVVKGLTQVVTMMTGMLQRFSGILGGPMAYMGLMIMFRQLKGHKGGFLGKEQTPVNTMTVSAQVVNINGKPIPPGGGPGGPGRPPGTPGGPGVPIPGPRPPGGPGPIPAQPGRPPLAIGPGSATGPIRYDQYGRPLYGGLRHSSDTRQFGKDEAGRLVHYKKDYPKQDAKLVGRDEKGRFTKLVPGTGSVGITGQGGAPLPGTASSPLVTTATSSTRAIDGAGAQRRVLAVQQRFQNLPPGRERDAAAQWLTSRGHPIPPPAPVISSGERFSTGATGGGGAPGGGAPGRGGPGTAPPGAGGPGTTGAFRRLGLFGRARQMGTEQAIGNTGVGGDLFRTKMTGRQWGGVDDEGRVHRLTREIDPNTGQRVTRVVGTYDDQTGHMRTKGQGLGTKLRYAGLTSRGIRDSALGSAVLGNDAKGIGGVNRSMGAKMGVGMGMSAVSQYMPEEAQGAMALGGMVGMYNPLAGLAVGLGGAALTARTGGGGALMGAGAGAAIGTMIAPGIGTAVGAGLGAITGAVMGFSNGIKQRAKEAKAAMGSFLDGISTRILTSKTAALMIQEERAKRGEYLGGPGALSGVAQEQADTLNRLSTKLQEGGFNPDYSNTTKGQTWSGMKAGGKAGLGIGAVIGGWMGTAIPLPAIGTLTGMVAGAIIGTVAGAVVGGVGGLIKGVFGRGRREQQINKDFKLLEQIESDPAFKGIISDKEKKALRKDRRSALKEMGRTLPDRIEAVNMIADQQGKRMKMLQTMSGKSGAELEVLAKKLGVNLYDATAKTSEIVEKLGLNMVKTAQQMRELNTDTYVNNIANAFDSAIKELQSPKIYDERASAIKSVIQGGGDDIALLEAVKAFQESALGMANPVEAYYAQMAQIGTAADPGALFGPNAAFSGVDPSQFFRPEVQQALTKSNFNIEKGFVSNASENISAMVARAGGMANTNQIGNVINSLAPEQRQRLLSDMEAGRFDIVDVFANKDADQTKQFLAGTEFSTKEEYMANQLSRRFETYGASGTKFDIAGIDTDTNAVADKMLDASETFEMAVNAFNANMGAYFTDSAGKPDWWSKEAMKEIMTSDTSTPRSGIVGDTTSSKLSQTMSRHNSINGSIAGKRSITSGYRTYGLGSLNSDHASGRALDLVGDNLVSYAVATRNAGGFAEFHGRGNGRHLHAVPGPGAIGDTGMPQPNTMGVSTTATVSGGGNSFTFHINGGQSNPEEIANMVMAKIKTAEQRVSERL